MYKGLRRPALALTLAFGISVLSSMDTTFAQLSFSREIRLLDTTSAQPAAITAASASVEPGLIDLGGVTSVDAHVMALVSLASRQVELARQPDGARAVAKDLIAMNYPSWNNSQFRCLNALWTNESHWNYRAHNYYSGAHGIAQAFPASKMSTMGIDWRTNPITQIKWGLRYVSLRYGTPCAALSKQSRTSSY